MQLAQWHPLFCGAVYSVDDGKGRRVNPEARSRIAGPGGWIRIRIYPACLGHHDRSALQAEAAEAGAGHCQAQGQVVCLKQALGAAQEVLARVSELARRCWPGSRSWPGDAGPGLGAGQEVLARVSELARRCWPGSWRCCFPGSRSCWPGSRSCSGGAGLGLAQEGVPALPGHGALGEAHSCQCRRPSLPCSILADHYRHVPIRIPLKTQACPCYSSWPRWPRQCP